MPVYEYECIKCGHHTEILQKITDPPISRCEVCKGKMKKLISQSTFHLKGTGWYVTDYASKTGGYDGKSGSNETNLKKDESPKEAKGSSETPKKESSTSGSKKTEKKV